MPSSHLSSTNSSNNHKNVSTNKNLKRSKSKSSSKTSSETISSKSNVQSNSSKSRKISNTKGTKKYSLKTKSDSEPVNNILHKSNIKTPTLKKETVKKDIGNIKIQSPNRLSKNIGKAPLISASTTKQTNFKSLERAKQGNITKVPASNTLKKANASVSKTLQQSNVPKISSLNTSKDINLSVLKTIQPSDLRISQDSKLNVISNTIEPFLTSQSQKYSTIDQLSPHLFSKQIEVILNYSKSLINALTHRSDSALLRLKEDLDKLRTSTMENVTNTVTFNKDQIYQKSKEECEVGKMKSLKFDLNHKTDLPKLKEELEKLKKTIPATIKSTTNVNSQSNTANKPSKPRESNLNNTERLTIPVNNTSKSPLCQLKTDLEKLSSNVQTKQQQNTHSSKHETNIENRAKQSLPNKQSNCLIKMNSSNVIQINTSVVPNSQPNSINTIPENLKSTNQLPKRANTIPIIKKNVNGILNQKSASKNDVEFSNLTNKAPQKTTSETLPKAKFLNISQSLTQTEKVASNMLLIGSDKDTKLLSPTNQSILTKVVCLSSQNTLENLRSPKQRAPSNNADEAEVKSLNVLKKAAEIAERNGRTYVIRGCVPGLRKAFQERDWVEKMLPTHEASKGLYDRSFSYLQSLMRIPAKRKICEQIIKSHYIEKVHFCWGLPYNLSFVDMKQYKYVNKFPQNTFSYTTKKDISDSLRNGNFVTHNGKIYKITHPRTYSLSRDSINQAFVEDYNITAAMSLLKWVLHNNATKAIKLISPSGKIPIAVYMFAANECCKYIARKTHRNRKVRFEAASKKEWNTFLQYFQDAIYFGNHFQSNNNITPEYLVRRSSLILDNLEMHCRYLHVDGYSNLWLIKPYNNCQGRGIRLFWTFAEILEYISNYRKQFFLLQKYLGTSVYNLAIKLFWNFSERPLLIYNTKFDIRQWFLITDLAPLKIWMYKKCYLKFSTQTFSLRRFHESIHLTNNSIQRKYENTQNDIVLPKYSMWDVDQFKTYLSNIGYPDVYDRKIYECMKQCIIGTTITNFKATKDVKNCFQLFGADFIITEDFEPWLLEINAGPAMYDSTPVTKRLTEQCFRDLLKVVVDYRKNPKANTGNFELIFNNTLLKPHEKTEHGIITEVFVSNQVTIDEQIDSSSCKVIKDTKKANKSNAHQTSVPKPYKETITLVEPKLRLETTSTLNNISNKDDLLNISSAIILNQEHLLQSLEPKISEMSQQEQQKTLVNSTIKPSESLELNIKEKQKSDLAVIPECPSETLDTTSIKISDNVEQETLAPQINGLAIVLKSPDSRWSIFSRISRVSSMMKDMIINRIWNFFRNVIILISHGYGRMLPIYSTR